MWRSISEEHEEDTITPPEHEQHTTTLLKQKQHTKTPSKQKQHTMTPRMYIKYKTTHSELEGRTVTIWQHSTFTVRPSEFFKSTGVPARRLSSDQISPSSSLFVDRHRCRPEHRLRQRGGQEQRSSSEYEVRTRQGGRQE